MNSNNIKTIARTLDDLTQITESVGFGVFGSGSDTYFVSMSGNMAMAKDTAEKLSQYLNQSLKTFVEWQMTECRQSLIQESKAEDVQRGG